MEDVHDWDDFKEKGSMTYYVISGIQIFISAVINIACLVYICSRKSKTRIEIMILNLVVANLFIVFLGMPLLNVRLQVDFWDSGVTLCQLSIFVEQFGFYLSSLLYMFMAIDSTRYLSTSKPISGIDKPGVGMIIAAWIAAIICTFTSTLMGEILEFSRDEKKCIILPREDGMRFCYYMNIIIFLYILPSLTMVICQTINYFKIYKSGQLTLDNNDSRVSSIDKIERTKMFQMLIIMGAIFIICWLPFCILIVVLYSEMYGSNTTFNQAFIFEIIAYIFKFIIVWLNPIISILFIYKNRKNRNIIPSN